MTEDQTIKRALKILDARMRRTPRCHHPKPCGIICGYCCMTAGTKCSYAYSSMHSTA